MSREFEAIRFFPAGGGVLLGRGALAELPARLDPGLRPMIVTDAGVADAGIVARLAEALTAGGIEHAVFDEIRPDPDIATVERALERALSEGCDAVIGLGGGSSLDAAKALAVRLSHPETLRAYGDGVSVATPILPLYAVPTTAGTGSEGTRVAVITDPERLEKMAIRGEGLLPRLAILDPELLATLPPRVAAACGADALTHAIEAVVSLNADPFSDALALGAIDLLRRHLPRLVAAPGDPIAAECCLVASHLAGRAFAQAGLGLVHSLCEPLGTFCKVEHGLACALLLPHVMAFNLPEAESGYARVARALGGEERGAAALPALLAVFAEIGIPDGYAAAGVEFELDARMIEQVPPQFSTRCNPRAADAGEVEALYLAPRRRGAPSEPSG